MTQLRASRPALFQERDLKVLDCSVAPTWIYSCVTTKNLWANQAALAFFNTDADSFLRYRYARQSPDDSQSFMVMNTLLRDEVELGGSELLQSGFGMPSLPGVPAHPELSHSEFLYKPIILSLPGMETLMVTLVQLVRSPHHSGVVPQDYNHPTTLVKTYRKQQQGQAPRTSADGGVKCSRTTAGMPGPMSVAMLLEVVENILAGRPVEVGAVEGLQQMLLRGEITVQSSRIGEELVVNEDLDRDVGLNLLQLLGSKAVGEKYFAAPDGTPTDEIGSEIHAGPLVPPLGSSYSPAGAVQILHGNRDAGGAGGPSPRGGAGAGAGIVSQLAAAGAYSGPGSGSFQIRQGSEQQELVAASLVPAMEAVLATVDEWRFDAFRLAEATQGHPLSALAFWLMKRHNLIDSFQLDSTKLARFLRRIEDAYPDNPYHNKSHAADVLQSMHVLLTRGGMARRLGEEMGLLAGYLAAIVHDVEHKGLNNDFLVRVVDDLALTYNDISPMENHHVAAAFRLMRQGEYAFTRKMPREKLGRLRRLLIDCVLATDMKQHFSILQRFQAKLQVKLRSVNFGGQGGGGGSSHHSVPAGPGGGGGGDSGGSGGARHSRPGSTQQQHNNNEGGGGGGSEMPLIIAEDEGDRSLVLQVALKCADVGHLAAPWDVHHRWVSGLEEEFFRQGDREKATHLTVSPLMDRLKDGITKSQVGFFDIVALPLFYSWATVFPDALPLVRAVEDNCNRWRLLEVGRNSHLSK